MVKLRIVTLLAALGAFAAGCAETAGTGAVASIPSDATAPSPARELTGTWRGWFVSTGSDGHVEGEMTLAIKDDATYKIRSVRRGRGDVGGGSGSNDAGVIAVNGRTVTLNSAGGSSIRLVRKGDMLYGVIKAPSGHSLQYSFQRSSGVPSESP